jgi:hypothetical protein
MGVVLRSTSSDKDVDVTQEKIVSKGLKAAKADEKEALFSHCLFE